MLRQSHVDKIKQAEADLGRALREFAVGRAAIGKVSRTRAVLRATLRNATSEEIAMVNRRPSPT
jgi:hypothetical protein